MSITSHDDLRDLLGAYAADAVDGDERRAVDEHLAGCELCRAEVASYREALALVIPSLDPPGTELWERIASQLEPAAPPDRGRVPVARRWASRRPALAAVAMLLAVAIALPTVLLTRDTTHATATAPVLAHGAARVLGSAKLYDPASANGRVVVDLEGIATPPAGHHYEVWVLRRRDLQAMEAVGSFTPAAGRAHLRLPLPGPGRYRALDISLQRDGGPAAHSSVSVAGATF